MSDDGYCPLFILPGLFFVAIISVCVINYNHNQNIRAAEQEKVAEEARIASVFKELEAYKNEHYGKEYEEILKDNNSYKELVRIKENYKKKSSLDENIFKYRKPKDLNYDLRDFIPSDKHFNYDSFEVENWSDIDAAYSDSVNKLQQDIDNLPEIKALNDKIKEDEGYKAILCKLDKGYAAKEKEKAKKLKEEQAAKKKAIEKKNREQKLKKLKEEQAAKKKAINKKNREQKIKDTNKNARNVAAAFVITIFAGLGISIGAYKGRKIIRKMKEERASKKALLEKFMETCK